MAKCLLEHPIRWLCFSLLLYFQASAIPSEAKEAGKALILRQTVPKNSTEPAASQQAQDKTPDQPLLAPESSTPPKPLSDTKSGGGATTANSVAILAKLATDINNVNNETVKRIETFYSNTVLAFLSIITAVATLVSFAGFVSVRNIANETANRRAIFPIMKR